MTKIFISYSRQDEIFVRRLASALSDSGADVWVDIEDIPAGMKWSTAIQEGLDSCEVMLLILSHNSMNSDNVEDEWNYFKDENKPIIPILLHETKVHFQLRRLQYIDFLNLSFDEAFSKLLEELKTQGISLNILRRSSILQQENSITATPVKHSDLPEAPNLLSILPEPFAWCFIPGGAVTLERGGFVTEDKQTFTVSSFYMAQYPITVEQYDQFITDGGYTNQSYWTEKGWQFKQERSWTKRGVDEWAWAKHPAIGVSWYEALAFCNWLDSKINYNSIQITLPTDQQWQRAAQGDDGRIYPWGNEFDPAKANTKQSKLEKTTPVDAYPMGASPYGVIDMAGNVWEWCISKWDLEDTQRVVSYAMRGGSFNYQPLSARTVNRSSDLPNYRSARRGFRICAIPK